MGNQTKKSRGLLNSNIKLPDDREMIDTRYQTKNGVLLRPVANSKEISAARKWMDCWDYADMKTGDGHYITPTFFADFSKFIQLSYKFSIGVMVYVLRDTGIGLIDAKGKKLA